jgi:hypothetical protein
MQGFDSRWVCRTLTLHVCTSEYRFALALAPSTVSLNNQLFRPTTNGRIEFSQALLSMG